MPNGRYINENLDFEKHITELSDRALIEFVARSQYEMSKLCPVHAKEIKALQNRSKKELGVTNSISAMIGVAIASAINYLMRRG